MPRYDSDVVMVLRRLHILDSQQMTGSGTPVRGLHGSQDPCPFSLCHFGDPTFAMLPASSTTRHSTWT